MYAELHEYLLLHQELPLPGFGIFRVKRVPAELDFANRQILGPGHAIEWQESDSPSADKLWNWLALHSGISLHEARHRLEKFIFQLKNSLAVGGIIHWNGVGQLKQEGTANVNFLAEPMLREGIFPAHKVIREKAEHMVKVGEEEKTSAEMTALLSSEKRSGIRSWQIIGTILLVLSIAFIAWHFSQHEWRINSANQQKLQPLPAADSNHTSYP